MTSGAGRFGEIQIIGASAVDGESVRFGVGEDVATDEAVGNIVQVAESVIPWREERRPALLHPWHARASPARGAITGRGGHHLGCGLVAPPRVHNQDARRDVEQHRAEQAQRQQPVLEPVLGRAGERREQRG